MFNLLSTQQQRATKIAQAQNLIDRAERDEKGPRPMTVEERALFDSLQKEIETLDARINEIQEHESRRAASAQLLDSLNQPAGRRTSPDQPAAAGGQGAGVQGGAQTFTIPATANRCGSLKAFRGLDGPVKAFRTGKWLRAVLLGDLRAQHWCATNGMPLPGQIHNAADGTDNTKGGALVPDEMAMAMIDLREEYGVFRQNCRVWPMGGDTLLIPRRAGGVTIGAIGENPSSAISQSQPSFSQVQLVAKKAGGLTLLSSEIAEDAVIDLADWVAQEFAYAFALFEDQCGFIGDQTSTYLGINGLTNILTVASSYTGAVACATASHDTFSEVDTTDLAALMGTLPQYALMNAKFYCSSVAKSLIFDRIKAAAGGNTVQTLQGTTGDNYLGYPIVVSQVLPAGAATDYSGLPFLFFGDLRKSSSLGDRRQIRIFRSDDRYMDTDQIAIRGTERFDIVNHDVGSTTAAGALVALCGGAS